MSYETTISYKCLLDKEHNFPRNKGFELGFNASDVEEVPVKINITMLKMVYKR